MRLHRTRVELDEQGNQRGVIVLGCRAPWASDATREPEKEPRRRYVRAARPPMPYDEFRDRLMQERSA